jgi:CubicO group peptidase (beta-lactamase class C family)
MSDVQRRVQAVMDELVAQGRETGLQVAAYLNGALVVDAWAGVADATTGRPVDGDTLFTVFSCSKGVTATLIHLLAEQGRLDYDSPIARYWPEFGAHGKQGITVRHALTHRAGVPHLPDDAQPEQVSDWDGVCRVIAGLMPLWEPGAAMGYHALTQGWLLGEVARRIDGRSFNRLVQEEICQPLGIDDLYFGIPDAVEPRVARLEDDLSITSAPPPPPDSIAARAIPASLGPLSALMNRPDVRRAAVPAGGGIMTARALARHYAGLIGPVGGERLLPAARLRLVTAPEPEEVDLVAGVPRRIGLTYGLGGPLSALGERVTAFGHGGYGGSVGFADPEYGFAFALTKTRMVFNQPGEGAAVEVARATRAALGIPER